MQKFFEVNPMYECVMPLRCLWLRDHAPEKWAALMKMEAHAEERKGTHVYEVGHGTGRDFQSYFGLYPILKIPPRFDKYPNYKSND